MSIVDLSLSSDDLDFPWIASLAEVGFLQLISDIPVNPEMGPQFLDCYLLKVLCMVPRTSNCSKSNSRSRWRSRNEYQPVAWTNRNSERIQGKGVYATEYLSTKDMLRDMISQTLRRRSIEPPICHLTVLYRIPPSTPRPEAARSGLKGRKSMVIQ